MLSSADRIASSEPNNFIFSDNSSSEIIFKGKETLKLFLFVSHLLFQNYLDTPKKSSRNFSLPLSNEALEAII